MVGNPTATVLENEQAAFLSSGGISLPSSTPLILS